MIVVEKTRFMQLTVRLIHAALVMSCTAAAHAQSYPAAPVRMIVPFPAGGGVDSAGRILATRLTESFGKSFVVENRGGANGNIGTEVVAKSPKDGYTLLLTGAGLVTNPSLYARVPYDVRDFKVGTSVRNSFHAEGRRGFRPSAGAIFRPALR